MGNCNSGDHIAGDYIHTGIATFNLERFVIDYWEFQHVSLEPNLALCFRHGSIRQKQFDPINRPAGKIYHLVLRIFYF